MTANDPQISVCDLDRCTPELTRFSQWLDADERARAAAFYDERVRQRFILSHGFLRKTLGAVTGEAPERLRFATDSLDKPYLADFDAVHFSLSHSEALAVVAVASQPLGVDIEATARPRKTEALAARFFSPMEQRALAALDLERRRDGFFRVWTSKEAILKLLGLGLRFPLGDFSVAADPLAEPALLAAGRLPLDHRPLFLSSIALPKGYVGVLARFAAR